MRPLRIVLLGLLLVAPGVASSDTSDPATEVIVAVSAARFDPPVVELRRGVRLTFHCLDELPGGLTVVGMDDAFESWALGKHGQWSHRFIEAGTFEYRVKEHPETRGRAVVK